MPVRVTPAFLNPSNPTDLNTSINMSFSASSKDIRLEHGHILHAKCENTAGNFDDSYIDLDHHIGNTDGKPHSESSGCYCYLALGQGD